MHTVLLNRAVRADAGDGKWRALYGKALWDEQLGLGADAERIFARLLTLLGIPLAQQEDGNAFEVGGVEQATMDAFSQRTRGQIDPKAAAEEAEYKRLYGREPSARTRWEWRQHLARSTRKAKPDDPPAGAERLAAWEEHSRQAGVQILSDLHTAVAGYGACHAPPAELSRAQAERAIRIAVAEVQSRHAAFSASQLLWELHRALPALPDGTDPVPLLEQLAAAALTGQVDGVDIVLVSPSPGSVDVDYLGTRATDGQSIYTAPCRNRYATTTQLDAEQHILTTAAAAARSSSTPSAPKPPPPRPGMTGSSARTRPPRWPPCSRPDTAVTVVRAAAGTGKTRLVGTFARAWTEATGGAVHVVTVSENAARVAAAEMAEAGAEVRAANLARFLGKQPDGTTGRRTEVGARDVIVLDEASQVATADWLHLADAAARSGARIIAVGDEYQLGAIGAGGVFTLLADRDGALELHEVHRFASEWEKQASLALRDGDLEAIADYQVQGRIFPAPEDQAIRNVVLDWAADIHAGKDALMIAQTEADVTELNRQAAEHLAKIREADGWRPGPERIGLADGNTAQTGDWIQARLNDHLITADGQWLANRDILQVGRIYGFGDDRQVEVRRRQPDGTWSKPFTLPAAYAQKSATLGYASTVYAAQGRTADTAHALVTAGHEPGNPLRRRHPRPPREPAARRHRPARQRTPGHPEAVLGQALATPASEQAATTEMDAALDAADHPARLIYLYQQITAAQRAADLDNAFAARLSADDYARYRADPARPALHHAIREAQLAGHDTTAIVTAITDGAMTGARSVAAVLHGRLQHLNLPERPPPPGWTAQLPEARAEGPARQAAEAMDERTRTIGEQHAARPQPWIVDRLGMPPAQPGALLDDWITRAGHAGFYRQAAHITDPHTAIGPRPEADPEKAAAWDHAARALNLDTGEHDLAPPAAPSSSATSTPTPRPPKPPRPTWAARSTSTGRPPPSSRGRPSSTRPPAATRTPPSPAPPPPGKPGSPTSSSPPTRPAPGGNATTNPSGWPPAPPARNSTAAASSPPPNPASPTPKPPTTGSNSRACRKSPAQSEARQQYRMVAAVHRPGRQDRSRHRRRAPGRHRNRTALATPSRTFGPAPEPAAKPRPTLQWQPEAGPDTAHVDPAWWAQIKAEQTARVQIAKAARRETAARAIPVTDAEIALYGTRHHEPENRAAEPEPLLAAPTEHDDPGAHETSSQYYARMQSYARWQPESHPEATAGPATAPEAHDAEPDLEP